MPDRVTEGSPVKKLQHIRSFADRCVYGEMEHGWFGWCEAIGLTARTDHCEHSRQLLLHPYDDPEDLATHRYSACPDTWRSEIFSSSRGRRIHPMLRYCAFPAPTVSLKAGAFLVICSGTLRTIFRTKLTFPKSIFSRPCSCFPRFHFGRPTDGTSSSPPSSHPSPGTRSPHHRSVLSAPRGRYGQNYMILIHHNGMDAVHLTDALRCLLNSLPVLSGIVFIGLQVREQDGQKTLRKRLHLWVPHPFCFIPQSTIPHISRKTVAHFGQFQMPPGCLFLASRCMNP